MKTLSRNQLQLNRSRIQGHRNALESLNLEPTEFAELYSHYSGILERIDKQIEQTPAEPDTPKKLHTVVVFDDPHYLHRFMFEKKDKAGNPKQFPNLDAFYNNSNYLDAFTDLVIITEIEPYFLDSELYSNFFKAVITSKKIPKGEQLIHTIPMIIGFKSGYTLPDFIHENCNIVYQKKV